MPQKLLTALRAQAEGAGLNLFGLVDRARFDACEPKERRVAGVAPQCGTVLVLGSGGRWLSQQRERWRRETGQGLMVSSAEHVAAAIAHLVAELRQAGVAAAGVTFDGPCRVRGERLAEAAGFGVVSPVSGLLLHPEYGPWLRVRGAICCDGLPFGPIADASLAERFEPCAACARPCITACPAHGDEATMVADAGQCADHRHRGGCADACASRAACPIGLAHRDHPGEDVHRHGADLETVRRWMGLGPWGLVPKSLRGGP